MDKQHYVPPSKFPPVRATVTLETLAEVSYGRVAEAVRLTGWLTQSRRDMTPIDIFVDGGLKRTTFSLTLTNTDRQPTRDDMDFWLMRIDQYLRGEYLNDEAYGSIPGYVSSFRKVAA